MRATSAAASLEAVDESVHQGDGLFVAPGGSEGLLSQ
jgi:hypothetical protein